jgi:hypothetical protein
MSQPALKPLGQYWLEDKSTINADWVVADNETVVVSNYSGMLSSQPASTCEASESKTEISETSQQTASEDPSKWMKL